MRIALIYSRQPGNQYAGGEVGAVDSENAWMYLLASGLAPLLRSAGLEVDMPDNTDYDRSGALTFADNVRWVNDRRARGYALVVSLHSNALGDACILYGTSTASRHYAEAFQRELNAAAFLPFGDRWEFNERKVSEVADTYPPAVLLEVGQHDRVDYAAWLRSSILDGSLARGLAAPVLRLLGVSAPVTPGPVPEPTPKPVGPLVVTTPPARARLAVDGDFGPTTKRAMQRWLGVPADGVVGPVTRKALQRRLRVREDGVWGPVTVRALQTFLRVRADGDWGMDTTRALQRYLNTYAPGPSV